MRSTAHFKGHPIHPALIPFPFAFLVGAVLFDVAGWMLAEPTYTRTAAYLIVAGIVFGLVAAVPGVIDYFRSVPPNSSGQRRARTHGILNVSAIVLFGVAFWLRGGFDQPVLAAIGLEVVAGAALVYSGWLGGVLVNRNMIGVDHRFANAGKWKEATLDPSARPLVAAREDELEPGQMKLLRVGDRRIALARTDDGYVAFDDRCTHRGGSLAGGVLIGTTVQCLWHGSQFDVETGEVRCGPAKKGIRCFSAKVKNGDVTIEM